MISGYGDFDNRVNHDNKSYSSNDSHIYLLYKIRLTDG
nr:MAG TPA: hypothetical protein [Caudoviricetes sp.]